MAQCSGSTRKAFLVLAPRDSDFGLRRGLSGICAGDATTLAVAYCLCCIDCGTAHTDVGATAWWPSPYAWLFVGKLW